MSARWLALVESNTTGTGRAFCSSAVELGLQPVLLTRDPDRYPYLRPDGIAVRRVDTSDVTQVIAACSRLAGDGLLGVTSSSEYFVATAARAARQLGLPAPDPEAVLRCRSKDVQRAALRSGGVPVPAFAPADDVATAVAAAAAIGHPVVLKPASGSGSVGVRLCRTPAETRSWAAELLSRSTDERGAPIQARILVEAAVAGPEFSVETDGGQVVAVVAKQTGPEPWFVETGHDVPAPVPAATAAALGDVARRALVALGLGWGAAHTELRLTAAGPVVIEVNPRLAGGMIPVAIRAATGVDLVTAVVARTAGLPAPVAGPGAGSAAVRFVLGTHEGVVTAVDGLPAAAAAPGVVSATATTTPGRPFRVTHSFLDRIACVVATGPDAATAASFATSAADLVTLRVAGSRQPPPGPQRPPTPDRGVSAR